MSGQLALAPSADLVGLAHELTLIGGGIVILLLEAFLPPARRLAAPLAVASVIACGLLPWSASPPAPSFGSLLTQDGVTALLSVVILIATLLCLLASNGYLRREGLAPAEYCALLLWCAAGTLLMLRATELLTIFVALELFSICLYTLAGYHRRNVMATESAIKYFLMGAFVSAFILLGLAVVYGETGSTQIDEIALALHYAGGLTPTALLGLLLLIAGFCFKLGLVPFHAWAPDAYQGAPTPFVAFFSVAPKVASVVVLVRLLEIGLYLDDGTAWRSLIALLSAASMIFGTLVALVQRDLKRMLAYSGIAHMGFLMIPLASWNGSAWAAIIVYLLAYALMNAGAFALASALYRQTDRPHLIAELAGWGYRFPGVALALTVCLLSLGGIPPTLGFTAKYLVFVEAVRSGNLWLALLGALTSVVGIFFYLRVVYVLYMQREASAPAVSIDPGTRLAGVIGGGGVLLLGLFPDWVLGLIQRLAAG